MHIEAKLRKLGLELPEVKKPAGLYVFTKRVGNLVYVSGQTPDIGSILQYNLQVVKRSLKAQKRSRHFS